MASVRQLPTPSKKTGKRPWVVTYTDNTGTRRQATPPSGLKRDAEKLRIKIENEVEGRTHVAASQSLTVGEATDRWLAECERRVEAKDRLRRVTLVSSKALANARVRPGLGSVVLSDLSLRQIQAWVERMAWEEKAGRPTISASLGVLRQIVKFAMRSGFVGRNVFDAGEVRVPGRQSQPIAVPTKEQVRALLAGSDIRQRGGSAPYLRTMLHLAVYAGLRAGEIRGLGWEHVDLDKGMLFVRQGMDRWGGLDEPKTAAGVRDIPMPPALVQELRLWSMRSGRPTAGLLFTGRGGWVQMGALDQAWRRLARRVFDGVAKREDPGPSPYHFHALRHVYASLLIEAGLPPKRVQYLMGHASITITFDRYGHLFEDPELVRGAMDRLGSGLAPAI